MKIYVASSWRNTSQQYIVKVLREAQHEVYDFRNPRPGDGGFRWLEIDTNWKSWDPWTFRAALDNPVAEHAFANGWEAMKWADAGVLVMPCGRSAHLEAGYFVGAGKPLYILLSDGEPELMYKMATDLCVNAAELLDRLDRNLAPSFAV